MLLATSRYVITVGMKTCSKCGTEKDDDEFYVYKKTGTRWAKCKTCHVSEGVARAAAEPEKHNARTRAWRAAHPGRATEIAREWQLRHPEQFRNIQAKQRFNINFNAMWEAQGGLCASCGGTMLRQGKTLKSVVVDHDRSCCSKAKSCGKCVRGLIHWGCNMVLGYAKDDAEVLRSAAAYVERFSSCKSG